MKLYDGGASVLIIYFFMCFVTLITCSGIEYVDKGCAGKHSERNDVEDYYEGDSFNYSAGDYCDRM